MNEGEENGTEEERKSIDQKGRKEEREKRKNRRTEEQKRKSIVYNSVYVK
jgi:hypothetical protein